MTPEGWSIKNKTLINWTSSKLKISLWKTLKRMKRQSTESEKIDTYHISDTNHKEFSKLKIRKQLN